MKASLLVLLMCVSAASMADEKVQATVQQHTPALEQYTYSMDLDVATVVSVSRPSTGCEAAPVQMSYLDSAGNPHRVQYLVMGTGCSNG